MSVKSTVNTKNVNILFPWWRKKQKKNAKTFFELYEMLLNW